MTLEEAKLRSLLYRAIVELSYVQEAEDISQCASAEGRKIVDDGMGVLGVNDLSVETTDYNRMLARSVASSRTGGGE